MRGLYFDWQGRPITGDEWHALMRRPRHVGLDNLGKLGRVSTVWLGLDHGYFDGPPLIFETLVFGGPLDETIERYPTVEAAAYGHEFMVMRLTSLRTREARTPRRPALFHNGGRPRK